MSDPLSRSDRDDAARFAAVFDAVVQGVVTIDSEGIIGSVNPACLRMFGFEEDELLGNNVKVLMPSPDAENHNSYIRNHLDTGEKKIIGIGREVLAQHKDGGAFPIHLSIGRYESSGQVGFVALIHDMTAQREAEAKLAEHAAEARLNRERLERMDRISLAGEMASGIAHEVNQPLSAIANYSRALLHMLDGERIHSESLRDTVEKIRLQSHRAGEIVRQMRDFVSKHSTSPQPVSINKTIDEVLSFAELTKQGRKVPVETDLTDALPDVLFDRVQLQQVILNLVNNAVEASNGTRGGRIRIRTLMEEGSVTLEVSDDGMGIDEVTEQHLFEPFFSSKRHGTGMGLAISHSIVEGQGGTIGFFRNPERGVTFYVHLPAVRSEGNGNE